MIKSLNIGGRLVGPGQPCLVIAEAGVNHNGSLGRALDLVDAAARAGAELVKFQSFRAEAVMTPHAPKAAYQRQTTDPAESQLAMAKALELGPQDHLRLAERCVRRGIMFLSTPFDPQSLRMLVEMGVPAVKISSGEVTNLPFVAQVGATGLPVIMSTGMADLEEVAAAVATLREAGCRELALLQCVSNYPAQPKDANLRAMACLAQAFEVPVGYSDHTLGLEVALAAVALGACVIEKHFTLDQSLPGPDHRASATPEQLEALVRGVRVVEAALGHGRKEPAASEANTCEVARRSLVAMTDLPAGTVLTPDMLVALRPGTGISPAQLARVLGRSLRRDLAANALLSWDDLA